MIEICFSCGHQCYKHVHTNQGYYCWECLYKMFKKNWKEDYTLESIEFNGHRMKISEI